MSCPVAGHGRAVCGAQTIFRKTGLFYFVIRHPFSPVARPVSLPPSAARHVPHYPLIIAIRKDAPQEEAGSHTARCLCLAGHKTGQADIVMPRHMRGEKAKQIKRAVNKAAAPIGTTALFRCWQRPIFPGRLQPSIVGTGELNFRVRNGNGWTLAVNDTNYDSEIKSQNTK